MTFRLGNQLAGASRTQLLACYRYLGRLRAFKDRLAPVEGGRCDIATDWLSVLEQTIPHLFVDLYRMHCLIEVTLILQPFLC